MGQLIKVEILFFGHSGTYVKFHKAMTTHSGRKVCAAEEREENIEMNAVNSGLYILLSTPLLALLTSYFTFVTSSERNQNNYLFIKVK